MELKINDNYEKILENVLEELPNELYKEINNLKLKVKSPINIINFIKWCWSTKYIYETMSDNFQIDINYKYIVGIAALRSIFDKFDLDERKNNLKQIIDFLPEKLYELIIEEKELEECPFELIENDKGNKYIKSNISGIILKTKEFNKKKLEDIKWTWSTVDIADAILTALAAKTILILEGPPGRGKTAITKYIFEALNIDYKRINFSQSTTKNEVFSRTVPKIDNNKISTKIEKKELLLILDNSRDKNEYYEEGLILDEMNLSPYDLLEDLYSYLRAIKDPKREYTSPDGQNFTNIGNIAIIITMNDSTMSNSTTSLSNSFLNLSHSLKLTSYTSKEMKNLIDKELKKIENLQNSQIENIINHFLFANQDISENKKNTFREVLKLREIFQKVNIEINDEVLNFILNPNKNMMKNEIEKKEFKLDNEYLYYDELKYPLNKGNLYELKIQFTNPEKEALWKIMIGLIIEKTILLIGDIGSGKTFIIEELAKLIGANLRVIQFNKDTTSYDLIGRLELNLKKKNNLKKLLVDIENDLMNQDNIFPYLTEFIVLNDSMNKSKILDFINDKNKINSGNIKENKIYSKIENLKKELNNQSITENIYFEFNHSVLLDAMEKGDWVLLDDINFAPQEIERLMSLLEEEPTLSIYENYEFNDNKNTLIYKKKVINQKSNEKKINPKFRLFITSSKDNVSSAIRSRCFYIKLKSSQTPKDYAIILSNFLINSNLEKKDIIKISKMFGNAFYELKNLEKQSNYILQNYILTPSNIVNFSKLFIKNTNNLSQIIDFTFFSSFKKDKKEVFIKKFIDSLVDKKEINLTIIENIKQRHEYFLSLCEKNIISYYFNKNSGDDKEKLNEINLKLNKLGKSDIDKEIIIENFKNNEIVKNIDIQRKELIKNLDNFTLNQIKYYTEQVKEVISILEIFKKDLDSNIYSHFYFLKFLGKILESLKGLNESYDNTKIKDLTNKNLRTINYFQSMIKYFEVFIPKEVDILGYEEKVLNLYYQYYKKDFQNSEDSFMKIHFKMIENIDIRPILKKFNVIFPNNTTKEKSYFNYLLNCKANIKDLFDIWVYYNTKESKKL